MKQTQEVLISIQVKQDFEEEGEHVMELLTQGEMKLADSGGYCISYEESEMTGLEGTTTTFMVHDKQITLTRAGAVRSYMHFEEGRRHQSSYDTPYGSMDVEIHTTKFFQSITETGGEISLDYQIEISRNIVGNNFFRIKVSLPTKGNTKVQGVNHD